MLKTNTGVFIMEKKTKKKNIRLFIIGAVTGAVNGFFGGGGLIATVSLLKRAGVFTAMGMGGGSILMAFLSGFAGVCQQKAQGINLLYFIPVSLLAVIKLKREKLLQIKTALLMGAGGIPATFAAGLLAVRISGGLLRAIFGFCVFAFGVFTLASALGKGGQR